MKTLTVHYDLACSPASYDFVSFLLGAEMKRIDAGFDALRVVVLPGPAGGFRQDRLPPFTLDERRAMLERIVVPMGRLLPSCVSVDVMADRSGVEGVAEGRYGFHVQAKAAERGVYPFLLPSSETWSLCAWPKNLVTITLRECDYWPSRNSNVTQWQTVANVLQARGMSVVVVRDAAKANHAFDGVPTSPSASCDLMARAQLYVAASMNFFVNNGPAWLAWFMGVPCTIFKMCSKDAPVVSAGYFSGCGLPEGSQLANARPGQKIVWADDDADIILREVDALQVAA